MTGNWSFNTILFCGVIPSIDILFIKKVFSGHYPGNITSWLGIWHREKIHDLNVTFQSIQSGLAAGQFTEPAFQSLSPMAQSPKGQAWKKEFFSFCDLIKSLMS